MAKTKNQVISVDELLYLFIEDNIDGQKELVTWFLNEIITVDSELILDKPHIRAGSFKTSVFDKYSTVEKTLNSVIVESYISGV